VSNRKDGMVKWVNPETEACSDILGSPGTIIRVILRLLSVVEVLTPNYAYDSVKRMSIPIDIGQCTLQHISM